MKRVLIINECYSNNLGDQAISLAAQQFYKDLGFDTDLLYLSQPSMQHLPSYDYEKSFLSGKRKVLSLKKMLYPWIWFLKNGLNTYKAIKQNYDLISIGGGQLINGSNTMFVSQFAVAFKWISKIIRYTSPKSKLVFLAVGAGGSYNPQERDIFKNILSQANLIFVRDTYSQQVLEKQFAAHSFLMPDIAFYGALGNPFKKDYAMVSIANYEEVVCRYTTKGKTDYFDEIFQRLQDYRVRNLEVRLFYTTGLDYYSALEFNKYCIAEHGIEFVIQSTNTLDKLMTALGEAKIVFSGRMHALILGMKQNCIVEVYKVSQKLASFEKEYVYPPFRVHEMEREFIEVMKRINQQFV